MGIPAGKCRSAEAGAGGETCGLGEIACGDLAAVGGFDARDPDTAIGADDGETAGVYVDDFAELAADAFGILGGKRLRVEDLERFAVMRRPGAGRRIAAANEIVDLPPGLSPIDLGVLRSAAALIGREALVLFVARDLAGLDEVERFHHRLDALREQPVEIDGTERAFGPDSLFVLV